MKRALRAFAASLMLLSFAAPVSAQSFGGRRVAGPEPGDNQEWGMSGRQLVGVGGQCLNVDTRGKATMQPCDPKARTQRFKFENGQLKTAARIIITGFNMMDEAWMPGCFAAGPNVIGVGYCLQKMAYKDPKYDHQVWNMRLSWWPDQMEFIGADGLCLDVSAGRTDPGAPVVAWGCSGGLGQRWAWR